METVIKNISVSSQIIELLDDLGKRFGIFIDWTQASVAPYLADLLTRYINYSTTIRILWIFIGGILLFLSIIFNKPICNYLTSILEEDFAKFIFICICVVLIIIIIFNISSLIKLSIIPEYFIIEKIQTLLNTK